jgi:Uncharacterized protein conserved in bacteria (DUF2325)
MDILEIDELENSVQDLISAAHVEVEAKRLERQRDEFYQKALNEVESRLHQILDTVQATLQQLPEDEFSDSLTRQKLKEKEADILQQLADAPRLASEAADRQLILQEERLLEEQLTEQTNRWRQELKADLLDMIAEQSDFYSATDAAVALRGYLHDLKAINVLSEVVDALINQINAHSEEGPVAKLRGSHEQTLMFIYNKALENRARVERAPNVQPRTRHRTSERHPNPYASLEGKVVIFGGHDRLESAVRNRLRDSDVDLVWCTAQAGLNMAQQAENHIVSADLVLIVTGYASHSLTEKAIQTAKKEGITPEMINTTGMTKLLEAIELGLKTQQLARRMTTG